MNATRDPDRLLRAWLDLMPDEAPDRTIAAVLQATETTRQVRPIPRLGQRRTPMNRFTVIAAVAVLALALAGGAYLLSAGRPGPSPSVAPTPVASINPVATSPTDGPPVVAAPPLTWGEWAADVAAVPGIAETPGFLRLSVDWQGGQKNGQTLWVQLPDLKQILLSKSMAAPEGELHVRGGGLQCGPPPYDDAGRYRWSRSADGLFLTLSLVDDQCAARAAVLARTWTHSLGAVSDGGPGVVLGVTPVTQVTLPIGEQWTEMQGILCPGCDEQWQEVRTRGPSSPARAFVVVRNPGGFVAPCAGDGDMREVDIPHTTDGFVAYVKGLPGATVTASATSIGGQPAVRVGVTIDAAVNCVSVGAFQPEHSQGNYSWRFQAGEFRPLYIVQMDATTTFLLWYEGTAAEEQAVLTSIKFIDTLPTP